MDETSVVHGECLRDCILVRDGKTRKRPDREQIQQIFQLRHVLIRGRVPVLHRSVDVFDAVSELDEGSVPSSVSGDCLPESFDLQI